jgi:hypothetical protein
VMNLTVQRTDYTQVPSAQGGLKVTLLPIYLVIIPINLEAGCEFLINSECFFQKGFICKCMYSFPRMYVCT